MRSLCPVNHQGHIRATVTKSDSEHDTVHNKASFYFIIITRFCEALSSFSYHQEVCGKYRLYTKHIFVCLINALVFVNRGYKTTPN